MTTGEPVWRHQDAARFWESNALGIRRLAVAHGPGEWTVTERWTSNALKPYFNDLVVHEGHAYGFDGFILASVDLADGKRKWKGGRYGNGQEMAAFRLPLAGRTLKQD